MESRGLCIDDFDENLFGLILDQLHPMYYFPVRLVCKKFNSVISTKKQTIKHIYKFISF